MKCSNCHSDNPDTFRFCGRCAAPLGYIEISDIPVTRTIERPAQVAVADAIIAGKFRILEEIGRGGMGVVYKAEDLTLHRPVALKFLPSQWTADPEARERFVHEARAASALDHPNICNIHEIGETDDKRMFIVMSCYDGDSLRDRLRRGPLEADEALRTANQIAQGMAAAHQKGIIHRDIKPANILITHDGTAKIVDFGLAKLAGQARLTREGSTVGTVAYMSPEQLKGEPADIRTDIWSVGVVLYEMVMGHLPFRGDLEQSLIHSILAADAEPISTIRKDLPRGLEQVILTCLVKNATGRYQSMEELSADLNAILEGLKPRLAGSHRFKGRILGVKKTHILAGGCALFALILYLLIFIIKPNPVFDSLVVLPFEDLSHDPEKAALAQDLSESLIFKFHEVGAIRVPMLSTVSVYQGSKKSARTIAREQNVRAVLYPVFERSGDTLRIRITVLDGSNELSLAAKEFPAEIANIRATEGVVVQFVAKALGIRLAVDGGSGLTAEVKVNPRAYDMYVKYKEAISAFNLDPALIKWKAALSLLQAAIAIDPSFASFYWALVEYWRSGVGYGFIPYKEAILSADEAAQRGLAIDRQSAEMHTAMGLLSLLKWNLEEARRHWQKAGELAPGDPMTHVYLSVILQSLGLFSEAIKEAERAVRIDPALDAEYPIRAQAFYFAGRYDEAIKACRDTLFLKSNSAWAQNTLALSYAAKGMRAETLAEAKAALSLAPPDDNILHLNVALAYAMVGHRQEAQTLLAECLAAHQGKPVDSYTVAEIYAAMGKKEKAFEWLERTYQEHSINITQLKVDPSMANVRSDPRYKLYLRAVGLEQ